MALKAISLSGSGDNLLGIAAANKKLRILSIVLQANAPVNIQLYAGPAASNVPLTGPMSQQAGTGFMAVKHIDGHWKDAFSVAAANVDLNVHLDAAVAVGGWVEYLLDS